MLPAPRRPRLRGSVLRAAASGVVLALAALAAGSTGGGPVELGRVEQVADIGAPPTPTGVVVTPGDGTLTVRWTPSSGASSYRIFIGGSSIGTTTSNPVTLTGATNGQSYTVTVAAIGPRNVLGQSPESDQSAPVTAAANDGVPPGAPTGAAATPGDRSATLRWTAPDGGDIVSYQVLDSSNTLVATTTAPTTSVTVSGLVNGTSYTFRIRATDQSRNTGAAVSVTVVPRDARAPGAPTDVTAVAGDRSAGLSWTAPTDTDLLRYEVRAADGTVVATAPAGTTRATATGLTNGTASTLRVFAVDTSENPSAGSAAVTVTPRDAVAPGAPTGVTATAADRSAAVRWTAPADTDLARYEVRTSAGALLGTAGAGATSLTVTGLTNGTAVTLVVRAVDTSANTSPDSTAVTVTPRDAVAPGAPTAVTAAPDDRRVTLSWTAPSDTDVVGHSVRTTGGTEVASVTGTTAVLTGLVNGMPGTWVVVAVDSSGNTSAASASVTATPRDSAAPQAPTAVSATAGDRRATLSWTPGPDADLAGHEVVDENGTVVATAAAGATSAVVTGLVNGTSRTFRVVASDTSGNRSPASAGAPVTPRDAVAPGAPTAVTATPGDRSAVVRWTAPADTDLARFEVRTTAGALLVTAGPGVTSVTVTGLSNGTALPLVVRAVDTSANASADSAAVVVTPRDAVAPGAPTAVDATPGDRRVTLTWTAPADADVAGYSVRTTGGTEVAAVTGTTAVLSGLVNGTAGSWVVVTLDTSGNASAASAAVTATPRDAVAPAAPTGVTATPGSGRATVSWTPGPDTDVVRFEVVDEGGAVVATASGTSTGAVVTGLVDGTARTFRVVAVDSSGNRSAASAGATTTPRDATPPAAPTAVTATAGDRRAAVSWTAPADTDLAGYEVRTAAGALLATAGPGATSVTVTGLVNGTAVTLVVRALDASGNTSPDSAAVTVTPRDAVAPAAPTGLTATAGERRVVLTWTAPADTDLARYSVRTTAGTEVASVTTTTATLTGLTPGAAQTWVVVAIDTSGNTSAASASATATPTAPATPTPTGVRLTPGDGRIGVSWTAVAGADSYVVTRDPGTAASASTTTTGTGLLLTGLLNGREVAVTVAAVVGPDRSDPSAEVRATPAVVAATASVGSGSSPSLAGTRDGRYTVVGTAASLEASDTNRAYELYLLDAVTGARTRIAPLAAGWSSSSTDATNSGAVALSDDGRYAILVTTARKAAADTNTLADVYRVELATGTWQLVSVPGAGSGAGKVSATVAGTLLQTGSSVYSTGPSVVTSADGRYVSFYSERPDLVTGDTNTVADVFRKDMTTGAVLRVSSTANGSNTGRTATGPALAMTPDGRFVVFTAQPSSGGLAAFRKDATTGELLLVSSAVVGTATTELAVDRDAHDVSVSDDGRYVGFSTANRAATSTPATRGGSPLAYRKDVTTGAVVALGSGQTGVWEHGVQLDPSGAFGFYMTASGQDPADVDGHTDWYRTEVATGARVLVTTRSDGSASPRVLTGSVDPSEYGTLRALSATSVLVATKQSLVAGDVNALTDVYAKDLAGGASTPAVGG